jgi:hypothetical protein
MQWQKKLYQHEEIPRPGVWDELKKSLQEDPYQISQALYEFSEIPPPAIWINVAAALNPLETKQQKPLLHKIHRTALSYAAAITGIGLFISILVFLFNNKSNEVGVKDLAAGLNFQDSQLLDEKKTNSNQNNTGIYPEKKETDSGILVMNSGPDNGSSQEKNTFSQSSGDKTIARIRQTDNEPEKIPTKPARNSLKPEKKVSYSDGNYILVYTPDGEYNRLSYKLADMVHLIHENGQTSKTQTAANEHWNKIITEWKEKIGQSTFIPSGSNFFDIAELAEMLNTEKY